MCIVDIFMDIKMENQYKALLLLEIAGEDKETDIFEGVEGRILKYFFKISQFNTWDCEYDKISCLWLWLCYVAKQNLQMQLSLLN